METENTHPLNPQYPLKDQQAYNILNVCVFVNTFHKEIESTHPLSLHYPLKGQQGCHHKCQCNCEQYQNEMEFTQPLNLYYPLKDQQAFNIINVCVFVNTIQREMTMDKEMNME